MKRLLAFTVVGLVALTFVSAAAADQTYPDPGGDAGAGTDLLSLTIANDASGTISLSFTAAQPLVDNHVILVVIDADRNRATGVAGFEYEMFAFPSGGAMFVYDGTTYVEVAPASFKLVPSGNVQQFIINRADLGNTSAFNLVAFSASVDGDELNFWDQMPNSGVISYTLSFPAQCANGRDDDGDGKVDAQDRGCSGTTDDNEADDPPLAATVALGAPVARAPGVRQGRSFSISSRVTTDSATVRVVCTIRVAGRLVRSTGRYANGTATCTGTAPAGSAGKRLVGSILVIVTGARQARTFSCVFRR
jgi:hypothetical protein